MAQKMCQAASMKYWYCIDYDVEIVDLVNFHKELDQKQMVHLTAFLLLGS